MINFQINDPTLDSQWRAIILFGRNSATYKFAFANSLLGFIEKETTKISLNELAIPFSRSIIEHLKESDKQGNSKSSKFLSACRQHIAGKITEEQLLATTEKFGFVNVVDAFQNVKEIVFTDNFLKLKESFHFENFNKEVEARWELVETAWNLNVNPNVLEVQYDQSNSLLFVENNLMKRKDITSTRDALNGYQKGKCFYSFQDISILSGNPKLCQVDHFLPHANKQAHAETGVNINGVWNLVLADSQMNLEKTARIPERRFLERLYNRNEFYIDSKHPLAETIINQTGKSKDQRQRFLQNQYTLALSQSIHCWKPSIELKGNF